MDSNIKINPLDLKAMHERYLMDPTVRRMFHSLYEVYERAVPRAVEIGRGSFVIIYPAAIQKEIDFILDHIKNYQQRYYPLLFANSIGTKTCENVKTLRKPKDSRL